MFRILKYGLSQTVRAGDLKFCDNVHPPPCVTCHMSNYMCHKSGVRCHVKSVFFLQSAGAKRGRGRPTSSSSGMYESFLEYLACGKNKKQLLAALFCFYLSLQHILLLRPPILLCFWYLERRKKIIYFHIQYLNK